MSASKAVEVDRDFPVRSFHLQGGCRALDRKDQLQLDPLASNGQIACLSTPSYPAAYSVLRKAGFELVGSDFYFEAAQADGRRPADWRAYHRAGSTSWPCADQADKWSFISHSAIREKNGLLWDIAGRVRHQLRTCEWRLRQVSECYRDQLTANVGANKFRDGLRFEDGFTWLAYLAIQSFLVDACVLRDRLAEYRALTLSLTGEHAFTAKVTRMATLKKFYLDKVALNAPVDNSLATAADVGGWLYELGSYRNLVVHFAPLASAGKSLYAFCTPLRLDDDVTIPSIKFPLPTNPAEISASRRSGAYFADPEQNYARFLNALDDPQNALDGLWYAHTTLGRLTELASLLSAISPVKPEMLVLTEKDIIDLKIIGPSGREIGST